MGRFVRMNLELEGYQVAEAGNGLEALEKVRDDLPDLVLLDVMMPDMDGFETLERLREISTVPVIMLTVKARRGGSHPGAGAGRRRLCDQTLQPPRAGQPHPGRAAPRRDALAGVQDGDPHRRPAGDRLSHAGGDRGRRADQPAPDGVPAALPPGEQRRLGDDPRDAAVQGVGLRVPRRDRACCGCTSPTCAKRSRPIRAIHATSLPSGGLATGLWSLSAAHRRRSGLPCLPNTGADGRIDGMGR